MPPSIGMAAVVRSLAARPREDRFYYYPSESYWATPFVGGSYLFNDENGARILDARAMFHFYATGITPAMTQAPGRCRIAVCDALSGQERSIRWTDRRPTR